MNEPVIQTDNLTRTFGSFTAVDHLTFNVNREEIFGFLGANGAGKTTAMKMLTGLLAPSSGSARVAGLDIGSRAEVVKQRIGYMSQRFSLYEDLTVWENIRFYAGIYGIPRDEINERASGILDRLNMETFRGHRLGGLPLGWKQKLAFSVAILHDPQIVFLDEPTSGVDPVTRRQFWEMIYEAADRGTTIFVTTHYMDEAEYCDRVSIMVDGRIEALDTPEGLKNRFGTADIRDLFIRLARKATRGDS